MEYELNLRRLLCPMPVIKTQKFVKGLSVGDVVIIYATDRGSLHDIPAWAKMYHHQVLSADVNANGDVTIKLVIGEK